MKTRIFALSATILVLTGCATTGSNTDGQHSAQLDRMRLAAQAEHTEILAAYDDMDIQTRQAKVRKIYGGKTRTALMQHDRTLALITTSAGSGGGVIQGNERITSSKGYFVTSYYADDGAFYGWYPNQSEIVRGTWSIEEENESVQICHMLPKGESVLGFKRGYRECTDAKRLLSQDNTFALHEGDIFKLAEGVPFKQDGTEIPLIADNTAS